MIRLQRVKGPLVHHDQTGFMRGRVIGDSLRIIEDSLRKIQDNHPGGMIIAIDFRKAFDSVRWSLITEALRWFNFGPTFINYVSIMFEDIETCLTNSGFTSNFFKPGRGIRQGCPASPYLFILVAEILAASIRQNSAIKGILHSGAETKLTQFADDLTCLISRSKALQPLLNTLHSFANWSGLCVNKDKSNIIAPGLEGEDFEQIQGILVVTRCKILGIWIDTDRSEDAIYNGNFKGQLSKIQGVCQS